MIGLAIQSPRALALLALVALRARWRGALALVWLCVGFWPAGHGQRHYPIHARQCLQLRTGFNWIIVAMYVRALLVSSLLIVMQLLRPAD